MATTSLSAYQTKIYQFVFGLIVLTLGLYGLKSAMSGATNTLKGIEMGCIVAALIFFLDRRYWLLFPVLITVGINIPGLPFNSSELGMIFVFAVHGLRMAFNRNPTVSLDKIVLLSLPLVCWVALVFALNPVGLRIAGSDTMGGRYYFDLFIAFFAFLSLSSLSLDEHDAKFLFRTLAVSSTLAAILSVYHQARASLLSEEELSSSKYFLIPFTQIYVLILARFSLSEIISRPARLIAVVVTGLLTLFSGKRQMFGILALVPILRVFLKRRDAVITAFLFLFGFVMLLFAVAGDDVLYTLPESATRSLSVVFPKYRLSTNDGGTGDLFRREIRKEAYSLLRRNPWFGRKGFAMNLEETAWLHFGRSGVNLFEGHAEAGNWHSMYLAYACDFGIPGLVFFLLFFVCCLRRSYFVCRQLTDGTYLAACILFCTFNMFRMAVFGWVSGHASLSSVELFTQAGFFFALVNGLHKRDLKYSPMNMIASTGRLADKRNLFA